jgi:hypothetical protein
VESNAFAEVFNMLTDKFLFISFVKKCFALFLQSFYFFFVKHVDIKE